MNAGQHRVIIEHFAYIVDELACNEKLIKRITDDLVKEGALSLQAMGVMIRIRQDIPDRMCIWVRQLLLLLKASSSSAAFYEFLNAINHCGFIQVADKLRNLATKSDNDPLYCKTLPIPQRSIDVLQHEFPMIVERLAHNEMLLFKIIDYTYMHSVLDDEAMQKLLKCPRDKTREYNMLDDLVRTFILLLTESGHPGAYDVFIRALRQSGFTEVEAALNSVPGTGSDAPKNQYAVNNPDQWRKLSIRKLKGDEAVKRWLEAHAKQQSSTVTWGPTIITPDASTEISDICWPASTEASSIAQMYYHSNRFVYVNASSCDSGHPIPPSSIPDDNQGPLNKESFDRSQASMEVHVPEQRQRTISREIRLHSQRRRGISGEMDGYCIETITEQVTVSSQAVQDAANKRLEFASAQPRTSLMRKGAIRRSSSGNSTQGAHPSTSIETAETSLPNTSIDSDCSSVFSGTPRDPYTRERMDDLPSPQMFASRNMMPLPMTPRYMKQDKGIRFSKALSDEDVPWIRTENDEFVSPHSRSTPNLEHSGISDSSESQNKEKRKSKWNPLKVIRTRRKKNSS